MIPASVVESGRRGPLLRGVLNLNDFDIRFEDGEVGASLNQ
jgi:hypothetical protein